ncbi:hypothetical protein FRX31_025676, partial [Thalictrum thalictroides]
MVGELLEDEGRRISPCNIVIISYLIGLTLILVGLSVIIAGAEFIWCDSIGRTTFSWPTAIDDDNSDQVASAAEPKPLNVALFIVIFLQLLGGIFALCFGPAIARDYNIVPVPD